MDKPKSKCSLKAFFWTDTPEDQNGCDFCPKTDCTQEHFEGCARRLGNNERVAHERAEAQ